MTRALNRYLLSGIIAAVVNFLVFTGYPNMLPDQVTPTDIEYLQEVDFINDLPRDKPMDQDKEERQETYKDKHIIPLKQMETFTEARPENQNLDLPEIDLPSVPEMDAGIAMGKSLPQAASLSGDFYNMGEVDQPPRAVIKNQPDYPYRARRLNLDGDVDIKFLVDKDGKVSRLEIIRATPPGIFDQSVIDTVSQWRFEPGMIKGNRVNTWMVTTIEFRISDL
ncbi:MAG: energy transducer TonB [Deltaproteobacteria bacterium]|nr:energy transducer TonB [Deltaproteobacteria bacterium]